MFYGPGMKSYDNNKEFQHIDNKNLYSETMRLQIKTERINEASSGNTGIPGVSCLYYVTEKLHITNSPC
jgi:hypothetical protein